MAKEVREPGGLNHPNERNLKNPASNRDGHVRPGDDRDRLEFLETGNLVVYTLDHLTIGKGGRKLLPAVHLGDVLDLFLRETGLHARQCKAVPFD